MGLQSRTVECTAQLNAISFSHAAHVFRRAFYSRFSEAMEMIHLDVPL
jgi:hypothetical protein